MAESHAPIDDADIGGALLDLLGDGKERAADDRLADDEAAYVAGRAVEPAEAEGAERDESEAAAEPELEAPDEPEAAAEVEPEAQDEPEGSEADVGEAEVAEDAEVAEFEPETGAVEPEPPEADVPESEVPEPDAVEPDAVEPDGLEPETVEPAAFDDAPTAYVDPYAPEPVYDPEPAPTYGDAYAPPPEGVPLVSADDGSRWALLGVVIVILLIGAAAFVFTRSSPGGDAKVAAGDETSTSGASSTHSTTRRTLPTAEPSTSPDTTSSTDTSLTTDSSTSTSIDPSSSTSTTTGASTTTVVAPPPAHLASVTPSVDFGTTKSTTVASFTNSGGQPLGWNTTAGVVGFGTYPASGTLAAGATATITVVLDRAHAPEGDINTSITLHTPVGNATIGVHAVVDRNPAMGPVVINSQVIYTALGCGPIHPGFTVAVTDDSPLTVVVSWSGPGGDHGTHAMTSQGGLWFAFLATPTNVGGVTYSVTATDSRGNTTTSPTGTYVVHRCS
jgi:hypothetical protein